MKLTKYHRDQFISSVMQDVPTVDYDEQVRDLVQKTMLEAAPPKVRELAASEHAGYINTGPVATPLKTIYTIRPDNNDNFYYFIRDKRPGVWKKLDALAKAKKEQSMRRTELEQKLRAAVKSVTTRKALADLLPEFKKYLPPEPPKVDRSLPVVTNVVAEFRKAGWPKGAKKAVS